MDFEALEHLGRLRDSGAITSQEFEQEKAKILSEPVQVEDHQPYVAMRGKAARSSKTPLLILAPLLLALCFGGYWLLRSAKSDSTASDALGGLSAPATSSKRTLAVLSRVRGIRITRSSTLPENPRGASACEDYEANVSTSQGRFVQSKGWFVTAESRLGSFNAVSFVGACDPITGSLFSPVDGNVAVFEGEQLRAIVYGKGVGALEAIPNSASLRITDGTGTSAPLADLQASSSKLTVNRVASTDRVCTSSIPLPNVFGMSVERARDKLGKAGWSPIEQPAEDSSEGAGPELREKGITEISGCSGIGLGFCEFVYRHSSGPIVEFTAPGDDPISSYSLDCSGNEQ